MFQQRGEIVFEKKEEREREREEKEGKKMMKMIPAGSRISREGNSSIFVVGPNCFFPRMRFLFRLDNGTRRLNSATVCFSPILNSPFIREIPRD